MLSPFTFLPFLSALKTKGNTPKYGLIFHSSFIGRAGAKHKGRISRYLANKCSMASRIDSFSDVPDSGRVPNVYGQKLKQQVEERLEFYRTGAAPKKNIDVMHAAMKEAEAEEGGAPAEADGEKKSKKEKKVRLHSCRRDARSLLAHDNWERRASTAQAQAAHRAASSA